MERRSEYSPEIKERAVRMVFDQQHQHESQWSALSSIAEKIGCTSETLRKWLRQAERDTGQRAGLTTEEPYRPHTGLPSKDQDGPKDVEGNGCVSTIPESAPSAVMEPLLVETTHENGQKFQGCRTAGWWEPFSELMQCGIPVATNQRESGFRFWWRSSLSFMCCRRSSILALRSAFNWASFCRCSSVKTLSIFCCSCFRSMAAAASASPS